MIIIYIYLYTVLNLAKQYEMNECVELLFKLRISREKRPNIFD